MRLDQQQVPDLANCTDVELIRSLFANPVPTAIMSMLFVGVALLCLSENDDPRLITLAIAGVVLSILRLTVVVVLRRRLRVRNFQRAQAETVERCFAVPYLAFAMVLGLFGALSLRLCNVEEHAIIIALVVGYAAGAAAGTSLRPRIAIPAIFMSVVPLVVSAATLSKASYLLLAIILTALMVGSFTSILSRYHAAKESIRHRQIFAALARTDVLTGLPNRMALADAFSREVDARQAQLVALHCLDLDRFKPVNDTYGHPIGDRLLRQVGVRLQGMIRERDLAFRIGGDEFIYLQTGVRHPAEAEFMARRLKKAHSEPYWIAEHCLEIGVSVGSAAASEYGPSLQQLLRAADANLYSHKSAAGADLRFSASPSSTAA